MTIKEALDRAIKKLKIANIEASVTEAGALLCYILKCDKVFLYSHNEYVLSEEENENFFSVVEERSQGRPFQYIVGYQEFMSLKFMVTPDVLIPRQDTEILVEKIIQEHQNKEEIHIIDIGTGSGCIAISLAHYLKQSRVTAVDVSEKALNVARKNSILNKVENKIVFLINNILLEEVSLIKGFKYDIVVSNPPYIPTNSMFELQREVKDYEPHLALDGGEHGLDFYKKIIKCAPRFLKPGGLLAFEIGYQQALSVSKIMRKDYHKIEIIKDLSGSDRVIVGMLNY